MPCYEGGGIWNSGTLTMMNSTVSGNTATFGGGISNRLGTLTVIDSTVSGNSAEGCFAGISGPCSGGGGIWNSGTLTMTNSTVSGSTADWGGGIYNRGVPTLTNSTVFENTAGLDGGGILNFETLTLTNSTVSGNNARSGGGIANSGDMLTVTNSTVSGNTADGGGGGIINQADANAEITNTTLSGNTARTGGGIYNIGDLLLASSTVARNAAATASGIYDAPPPDTGLTLVNNTLIEGDCADTPLDSNGYNIESPGDTCGFDVEKGDLVNVSADELKLKPLDENGGPTETHALESGSAAIDQIPKQACVDADGEPLTTDQRGRPRPEPGGSMCDVGAFELQP
jgi:hypothetical protein